MSEGTPTRLRQLRKRAEELLIEGHRDRKVMALLETIADEAEASSEPALFAHRQLAELRLEDSPWQAALHLRRLTSAGVDDDGVFALLGLCHALMGNFRTAVTAYRRALQISGGNPWYHHNLGHLLDVGLGQPRRALYHLREACRLEPQEDEITASLAHCMARLDRLAEARDLAEQALQAAPGNTEHQGLLEWILGGAKTTDGGSPRRAQVRAGGAVSGPPAAAGEDDFRARRPESSAKTVPERELALRKSVAGLLQDALPNVGMSEAEVRTANLLWQDYCDACPLADVRPALLVATVEYAVCRLRGRATTQAAVAERHGVTKNQLASRYRHMRQALELAADASRYSDA